MRDSQHYHCLLCSTWLAVKIDFILGSLETENLTNSAQWKEINRHILDRAYMLPPQGQPEDKRP